MVRSRGKWIALEHADLVAAANAIADRADQTKMTGAAMLRHALGVEGSPFGGGISLGGASWASSLLKSADDVPSDPTTIPEGFSGELRSYQAEAVGWLTFLDAAGLGGCLALDMGLGKTPTILAHLRASGREKPSLVIAPPAVVGNWASEAAKFVPDLRVVVHHGPKRLAPDRIEAGVEGADIMITTYGTAVRDVEAISKIAWDTVVIDEAPGDKEPGERYCPAASPYSVANSRRSHRYSHRKRARRSLVDSRLHQSRSGRAADSVHSAAVGSGRCRWCCGVGPVGSQWNSGVPPHQSPSRQLLPSFRTESTNWASAR